MNCEKKINERSVILGPEICRFETFTNWVNKAPSWLGNRKADFVCIDALGRVCTLGQHFTRAFNDESFPVVAYEVDLEKPWVKPPADPPLASFYPYEFEEQERRDARDAGKGSK